MAITVQIHFLEIDTVGDVVVTNTMQSEDTGDYTRDIRVMDEDGRVVCQLRLRSILRENINITAPEQTF
jgi:hypothetical protein